MKPSTQWILYSVIRLAVFAAVLTVLVLVEVELWLAAIIAAVIGLCVSYLFLRQPPTPGTRAETPDADADAEDASLEGDGGRER